MFKDRLFLHGLGIGLIIGAVLLQLMNAAAQPPADQLSSDANDAAANVEQINRMKTKLESVGYQVYGKDVQLYSQEDLDQAVVRAKAEELAAVIAQERDRKVTVVIAPGTRSEQLADQLAKDHVIDDARAFEDELGRRKLASRIRAGTFTFDGKPSIDELIRAITSAP